MYLKLPDAMACYNDKSEYTWSYFGGMVDDSTTYSLQLMMLHLQDGLGYRALNFAFNKGDDRYYANSTYGGDDKNIVNQALAQSISWIVGTSELSQFSVTSQPVLNSNQKWAFVSTEAEPIKYLYKGWVGQPGLKYHFTGTGQTYLWKNSGSGSSVKTDSELYNYSFDLTLYDERGVSVEGFPGGYLGPVLVPESAEHKSVNVEYEIAQPRLKVFDWSVSFTSNNPANGFDSIYSFSGKNGMLYGDLGPVLQDKSITASQLKSLTQENSPELADKTSEQLKDINVEEKAALYNGNWFPIQFTSGMYKGATLVGIVFWNKATPDPADQNTDIFSWSTVGALKVFTGLIPGNASSTFSLIETLYPQNPSQPPSTVNVKPHYRYKFISFADNKKYDLAFPWVQSYELKIKENTPARYALAAYANMLAQEEVDDPTEPLFIKVEALYPFSQNTLFSSNITQYYEGSAVPYIDDQPVGHAWIEHMVK